MNNTGKTFNVKNKTVIAFIEHFHRTDLDEPCTYNSTHTCTVSAKIDNTFTQNKKINQIKTW